MIVAISQENIIKFEFFQKNEKFVTTLKSSLSMTYWFKISRDSAFESSWCIFSQNKKNFYPSSIPFDFCNHWGRVKIGKISNFRNWKIHPSSIVAGIEGDWGRMKNFLILWKYASRAFKRTVSHWIWTKSHGDKSHWSFKKKGFFSLNKTQSSTIQRNPLKLDVLQWGRKKNVVLKNSIFSKVLVQMLYNLFWEEETLISFFGELFGHHILLYHVFLLKLWFFGFSTHPYFDIVAPKIGWNWPNKLESTWASGSSVKWSIVTFSDDLYM